MMNKVFKRLMKEHNFFFIIKNTAGFGMDILTCSMMNKVAQSLIRKEELFIRKNSNAKFEGE